VKVARPKGFEPLTSAFGVLRASCLISFSGIFSLVSCPFAIQSRDSAVCLRLEAAAPKRGRQAMVDEGLNPDVTC